MGITNDFEMAASAPDDALAKAVRDPMASPISQIAALSELRNRQQMRQEASAMQANQPTVADKTLRPIGYARGGLVQGFANGSDGPVRRPRDIQIDPYYQKLVNDYIARAERFESKGNPNARPIYKGEVLSSASGRFQMLDSTRRGIDRRYGFDPKDRSAETERKRMMVYTNDTINQLEAADIPITGGTLYGGHLLGQKGVESFMKAYAADPNMRAQDFFSPEVIRVNPGIFDSMRDKKLTTQTNKTLADVMNKFDQVGIGKGKTPRRQEDSDIGAATQFANRIDTGDTGAGYQSGPGYEDANLALANMLAQNPDLIAPIGKKREEAPQQQSFFYNPADAGPSYNPASEAEDMEVLDAARKRDQDRMRKYREQSMGEMSGFKDGGYVDAVEQVLRVIMPGFNSFANGGVVQAFRDGSRGPIRRPDGSLVIPLDPYGPGPGPGYDPLAYTGTLLGQPDMPPPPESMTGMQALEALYGSLPTAPTGDELQRRAESALQPFQPAVPAPSIGTNPFASTKGEAPMISGLSNPFGLTGEPARIARDQQAAADREKYYTETLPAQERKKFEAQLGGAPSRKAPMSKADLIAPMEDQTKLTPRAPRKPGENAFKDFADWSAGQFRAGGAGMENAFNQDDYYHYGDPRVTSNIGGLISNIPQAAVDVGEVGLGAVRTGLGFLGTGVGALGDIVFGTKESNRWMSDQSGDKKVPIERGGKKTPAAPAAAPPQTKQRAGAPANAPVAGADAGTGAGIAPAAPSGGGVGAGGAAGTKPVAASQYGPMEQFVRDLYARDEDRRARMTEREEEARSMARLKAGLAIMGGRSPYFAQNLAAALPVIQQYEQQMAGMAGDEDQYEQELRQRLIGARTGDIQMQAMQQRQNAEISAKIAEANAKIAEERSKGMLTYDKAYEILRKDLVGTMTNPGPFYNKTPAEQEAEVAKYAAQAVNTSRLVNQYGYNAPGNPIKAPGVQ